MMLSAAISLMLIFITISPRHIHAAIYAAMPLLRHGCHYFHAFDAIFDDFDAFHFMMPCRHYFRRFTLIFFAISPFY